MVATTYHVDGSVAVSGDGSEGNPYKTIGEAITQAVDGDSVAIAAGTYAESLAISEALTLTGSGGVTIAPGSAVAAVVDLSGTVGAVSLQGITIDGDGVGLIGIRTAGGASVASLTLTDVTVREVANYGLLANPNTLQSLTIDGGTFSDNGTSTVSGAAHIHLWGFTGDASLTDVTITGAATPTPTSATNPEYGIQFTGLINEDLGTSASPDIGTVVLDGVVVTGAFGKNAFAVFNYGSI
ncbi:MAG: DUF1565 domain-containing protein, partial [Alphaproteobacteria bacterium]|nr:DUF1565 domain-containing protein [Alphaproteobacteria bacterium]